MKNLGLFLRKERENQGLSIEQISTSTKISKKILYALESGDKSQLPALPFVKGFVHAYARRIGVSSLRLFKDYADEFQNYEIPEIHDVQKYVSDKNENDRSRKHLWIALGLFALLGGGFSLLLKTKKKSEIVVHKTLSPVPPPVVQNTLPPVPPPVPMEEAPKRDLAQVVVKEDPLKKGDDLEDNEVKHQSILHAKKDLWVRYQTDEKDIMEFILKKDKYLVLKAKKKIVLESIEPALLETKTSNGYQIITQSSGFMKKNDRFFLVFPKNSDENFFIHFLKKPGLPLVQVDSSTAP